MMGVPNERMTLPLKAWPVKYQYIPHQDLQKKTILQICIFIRTPLDIV